MKKYMVFLDMDGTLTDDTQNIPQSAIYAIKEAQKNGHKVILNTGRCKSAIFDFIMNIGFDGIIGSSGGYIEVKNQILQNITYTQSDVIFLTEYFNKYNIGYCLECDNGMFVDAIYKQWIDFMLQEVKDKIAFEKLEEYVNTLRFINQMHDYHHVNKISFVCSLENYDTMYDQLNEKFSIVKDNPPLLNCISGEISLKNVNKAQGIKMIQDKFQIKDNIIMAIGNSDNDIEMIKFADVGISVEDGSENLKKVADEVTYSAKKDGIYHCFVKHNLIKG